MAHAIRYVQSLLLTALLTISIGSAFQDAYAAANQEAPAGYVLTQAYPNPFNPTTSFSLTVHQRQRVVVEVYNILGRPVAELFRGVMQNGETRTFTFEAGDLPTGIYFYRVTGERFQVARQITLIR